MRGDERQNFLVHVSNVCVMRVLSLDSTTHSNKIMYINFLKVEATFELPFQLYNLVRTK